jgi:hypothetical protein
MDNTGQFHMRVGVPLHKIGVPDLLAHLRVILPAQSGDESDADLVRLGPWVRWAAAHRDNYPVRTFHS